MIITAIDLDGGCDRCGAKAAVAAVLLPEREGEFDGFGVGTAAGGNAPGEPQARILVACLPCFEGLTAAAEAQALARAYSPAGAFHKPEPGREH